MTCLPQICRTTRFILIIPLFFIVSCAYFNTFYNAEEYYQQAEDQRLEKAGESIPPSAIDAYGKVIEKSQVVIDKYPESKYVKPAYLLIGKSRFHRNEYRLAETVFKYYAETFIDDSLQAEYWLALCKWKQGKPQPALESLNVLLKSAEDEQRSSIHLSIAEIHLDTDNPKLALENLTHAAETNNDRNERGQIYYRIADLAFKGEDYQQALSANIEVVKNTTSKKRKEDANLQIVRIHRLLGNWDEVKKLIKTMLLDDSYKKIHGDLELELVKLYQMDHDLNAAINRLESIKESYKNSKTSAEAYFIHGEIALYDLWDLEDAKKYFGQVTREFRQSEYTPTANLRAKEITKYNESLTAITALNDGIKNRTTQLDSIVNDSIRTSLITENNNDKNSIVGHVYNLGELEAFHFKRQDSSIVHFQQIINDFPDSENYPKALFVLYYIHSQNENIEAAQYSEQILEELPASEYADYLRKVLELPVDPGSVQAMLRQGELEWLINPTDALMTYKQIIHKDDQSESAMKAALFLAHHYDNTFYEADSALKYYTWLQDHHSGSDQAEQSRSRYEMLVQGFKISKVDSLGH